MSVKRYGFSEGIFVPKIYGGWVDYEEYLVLESENARLKEQLDLHIYFVKQYQRDEARLKEEKATLEKNCETEYKGRLDAEALVLAHEGMIKRLKEEIEKLKNERSGYCLDCGGQGEHRKGCQSIADDPPFDPGCEVDLNKIQGGSH